MEKEILPCAVLILFTIVRPGSTQVASLPTVTGPDVLVTDGTCELHLTCVTANPSSVGRYLWFTPDPNTERCQKSSDGTECTFTPTLLANEKNVTCRVLGKIGQTLSVATYTVNLTYSAREQIGGSLHCPDSWIEGKLVTLEFLLNISLFQHVCTAHIDNSPFFVNTQSLVGKCVADNATNTCGSFALGTLGCGCTRRRQGNYVVQYNFIAHPDFNGNWSAGIICEDTSRVQQLNFTAINCDDKQVTPLNTTTTSTTTTEARGVDDNSTEPGGEPADNSTTPGGKPEDNTTPGDTESTSSNALAIGLGVAGAVFVVMAVVGCCCFRKRRSEGQHKAPPDNAPPANAAPAKAALANVSPAKAPPAKAPLANVSPPHALQVSGGAVPSTEKTAHDSLDSEVDDSSVADSEASEGTEESCWASEASEV